jgi:hypothetical protein
VELILRGSLLTLAWLPVVAAAQSDPPVCAVAERMRAAQDPQAEKYQQRCEMYRAKRARTAPQRPVTAPGQPASAPAPASATDDWASNLPSVATVKAAINGSDTRDTSARQEAAFATLCDYIEARNGGMFKAMPPNLQSTWQQYNREQSRNHPALPRSVSPAAQHYFNLREFREATLTKLISATAFNVYAQTASYRELPTAEQRTSQADGSDFERRIEADVKKAKKDNATLLGVPLGVPLDYAPCPAGVEPPTATRAFGVEQLADALGASKTAKPTGAACWYDRARGSDRQLVFLQLPVWVVMPLDMNMAGLTMYGATLMVRETDDLYKQLLRKYGKPTSIVKHTFQNAYGASVVRDEGEWLLPGVYVHYTPEAGNRDIPIGRLEVQLETMHQLSQRQQEKQDESGPRL